MARIRHYAQLIFFDTLAVICIIAAIATGWLPGPGGIPLVIVGLSLLAINHEWAQRYVDLLRQYADRAGDLIFVQNPKVQLAYDVVAPLLLAAGVALFVQQEALWMLSAGIFSGVFGVVIFLGNRSRWHRLWRWLRRRPRA